MSTVTSVPFALGTIKLDLSPLQTTLGAVALFALALYVSLFPLREYRLLYKNVRGPSRVSALWGNGKQVFLREPLESHQEWVETYGPTFRWPFMMGSHRIASIDPLVMSTVLNDTDTFVKPPEQLKSLGELLGQGVLVVQHEHHRRQRRVMAPAFGPAAIRALEDVFMEKAVQLRNKINDLLEDESVESSPTPAAPQDKVPGARKVDIEKYLAEMALDIIGVAGFDYHFDALTSSGNELAEAYHRTFSQGQRMTTLSALQRFFPILNIIPSEAKRYTAQGLRMTEEIGAKIVDRKKKEMDKGTYGKDLLSLLMKANMSPEVKKEDRLSDAQVMAQITTFMLAGNETSSTALTFTLWRLAQNKDVQAKLRAELRSVPDDQPSLDTLYKLPYLDNVVRESLRLDSPVAFTGRITSRDTVIPLSMPVVGRDGTTMNSITLNKGTLVDIPILAIHRSKAIWGPDAMEFKPDRWDGNVPKESVQGSVYGQLLTFLAGPRNCIGYRMALAEIKTTLFMLLRTFEFDILPSKPQVIRRLTVVQRPVISGEEEHGNQMPLLVRLAPEE